MALRLEPASAVAFCIRGAGLASGTAAFGNFVTAIRPNAAGEPVTWAGYSTMGRSAATSPVSQLLLDIEPLAAVMARGFGPIKPLKRDDRIPFVVTAEAIQRRFGGAEEVPMTLLGLAVPSDCEQTCRPGAFYTTIGVAYAAADADVMNTALRNSSDDVARSLLASIRGIEIPASRRDFVALQYHPSLVAEAERATPRTAGRFFRSHALSDVESTLGL